MKILWFTNTPSSAIEILDSQVHGGGWLKSLQNSLLSVQNVDLSVAFLWNKNVNHFCYKNCNYYPIFLKTDKSKYSRLLNRVWSNKKAKDSFVISKMLDIIEIVKPDIIHIHGTEECFGLIQKFIQIPVVISVQGILNPIADFYFSGISSQISSKGEGILNKLLFNSHSNIFANLQYKKNRELEIFKYSTSIIGRTEWDRRVCLILAPQATYYYNDEIIRELFYKHNWNKQRDKEFNIVTTTSDSLYKGFELILKTALKLQKNDSFKFNWNIIGLTETNSTVKIVKKMFGNNLEKYSIKLLGKKTESEVIEILLKSDVYCQVSHIENSPNSLCEAMLLGMPIISTYAGGTTSLITEQEGYIVQTGDSFGLAGAIVDCFNDYNKSVMLSVKAKGKAHLRHNTEKIVMDLIQIYKSVGKIS